MATLIGYHTPKIHNCYCGATFQYGSGEISYNGAGVGRVKCPACGAYQTVDVNRWNTSVEQRAPCPSG